MSNIMQLIKTIILLLFSLYLHSQECGEEYNICPSVGFEKIGYDGIHSFSLTGTYKLKTSVDNKDDFRSAYMVTGKEYYVDQSNGNDTNDGLTLATAFETFSPVWTANDYDVINVSNGCYSWSDGLGNTNFPTRSVSIVGTGNVDIGNIETNINWTPNGTIHEANYNAAWVLDKSSIDTCGAYNDLIEVNSIAEVNNTTESWYSDGTNTYVNSANLSDLIIVRNEVAVIVDSGNTAYIEGVNIYGSTNVKGNNSNAYLTDVGLYYSAKDSGISASDYCDLLIVNNGINEFIFHNSIAAYAYCDGLNYNGGNIAEINSSSKYAGLIDNNGYHQNSTGHVGAKILSINSEYMWANTANIQDTNNGGQRCLIQSRGGYNYLNPFDVSSNVRASNSSMIWVYDSHFITNGDYTYYTDGGTIKLNGIPRFDKVKCY